MRKHPFSERVSAVFDKVINIIKHPYFWYLSRKDINEIIDIGGMDLLEDVMSMVMDNHWGMPSGFIGTIK